MKNQILAHHRPQWKTHIGFVLAAVGSAIGLGNIWRFSYLIFSDHCRLPPLENRTQ